MASKLFDWLPRDPHSAMMAAIVGLFRSNLTFCKVVDLDRSFATWDGDPNDFSWPSERETPWVRLTFHGLPGGWRAAGRAGVRDHSMPMLLDVETAVSGSDREDLAALWWIASDCILPRADDAAMLDVESRLNPLGLLSLECIKAGWGIESRDANNRFLFGHGQFKIDMAVNT